MDLNQFVQERLSRGTQQAQQLLAAASTFYRQRSPRFDARAVVSVAAAYRRAYAVSRELQTPAS